MTFWPTANCTLDSVSILGDHGSDDAPPTETTEPSELTSTKKASALADLEHGPDPAAARRRPPTRSCVYATPTPDLDVCHSKDGSANADR
jgi:hypothetical protein